MLSRIERPVGSLPACAAGDVATRIPAITAGPSLPPTSFTRTPSVLLTGFLPLRERYGLTLFRENDPMGLGSLFTPVALAGPRRKRLKLPSPLQCLLAQACQHLWLVISDDAYKSSLMLTIPSTLAPSLPDAGRYIVPSRFGCQSYDCGYVVRRLYTICYLLASLRRVLLVEQQVGSDYCPPDNHFRDFPGRTMPFYQPRCFFSLCVPPSGPAKKNAARDHVAHKGLHPICRFNYCSALGSVTLHR